MISAVRGRLTPLIHRIVRDVLQEERDKLSQ
jgi:hypothetical protein